ncbi:antibiotic biosynthesis monooxygenase [uncultured Cohaesibacter sp.]|uniref:antibiotic biosynthesis monooxygenase family protein n=1 Tax=uncultured Cohaesibacter sp. TaxID=1002546 RepID=UPI002AA63993|nr:antibiotic biosynthesis monooxygenase [uncultured Cohaesibacter sp.]
MIAVIFEAWVPGGARSDYLDLAAELRPLLSDLDGFLSIERFQSLNDPEKVLSLSFWRDEAAVAAWRTLPEHRRVQSTGRDHVFADYHLRIAAVARDYSMTSRDEAPADSRTIHKERTNLGEVMGKGHSETGLT